MRSYRRWIAWLWTFLILAACWTPKRLVPEGAGGPKLLPVPHLDKLIHFLLFAGFALLWQWANSLRARWLLTLGTMLAALSELGQMMPVVNRDAGWADLFADVLGLLGGFFVAILIRMTTAKASLSQSGPS